MAAAKILRIYIFQTLRFSLFFIACTRMVLSFGYGTSQACDADLADVFIGSAGWPDRERSAPYYWLGIRLGRLRVFRPGALAFGVAGAVSGNGYLPDRRAFSFGVFLFDFNWIV
ncbi:MAG: hypothetical protein COT71_02315, partial [Candidatus Andersenbacteria bacterium CG10_big_fil_rev_8_21_14_0_10_54_11]